MKLRNKKTGEIVEPYGITCIGERTFVQFEDEDGVFKFEAHSLAELNEKYEDYEEPKSINAIDVLIDAIGEYCGEHSYYKDDLEKIKILNNFEEKVKAWKRLKDKGAEFYGWRRNQTGTYELYMRWEDRIPRSYEVKKDLDLLFGGEE